MDSKWIPILVIPITLMFIFLIIKYILTNLVDRRISNYQNDLISKHFNEVENIYKDMR